MFHVVQDYPVKMDHAFHVVQDYPAKMDHVFHVVQTVLQTVIRVTKKMRLYVSNFTFYSQNIKREIPT